jgi:hypothetical protein
VIGLVAEDNIGMKDFGFETAEHFGFEFVAVGPDHFVSYSLRLVVELLGNSAALYLIVAVVLYSDAFLDVSTVELIAYFLDPLGSIEVVGHLEYKFKSYYFSAIGKYLCIESPDENRRGPGGSTCLEMAFNFSIVEALYLSIHKSARDCWIISESARSID